MSFLLDRKLRLESECEAAVRRGDAPGARRLAALAAEAALALVEQTRGAVAERLLADAEAWLELADRIARNGLPRGAASGAPPPAASRRDAAPDAEAAEGAGDWLVTGKPDVTFAAICGMEEAKRAIHEMILLPLKARDAARALGVRAGGGVLLYGPPGNGKTTLGKAIANELDAPFYYASGAQIRSKWHGESEQRLRKLIRAARSHEVAVLFFDDVDGLLPRRGGSSVVDNRIVVEFLAQLGGFEDNARATLVLGATNCPWEIDEAVFRTGRFDEKLFIGLPDAPARRGLLDRSLGEAPRDSGIDLDAWTTRLDGFTGSDIVGIVNGAKRAALARSVADGAPPCVTQADLEGAQGRIPSSVTPALMRRYATFRQERFG